MASDRTESDPGAAWTIEYGGYAPADEGRREALFALGNGMFVVRAAAVDARQDAVHYPGTYRAGCYDLVADVIEGDRHLTETLVNLPNWLPLDFRIDGGPWFRLDTAGLAEYRHAIDLRCGTATRAYTARDGQGRAAHICEHRLVSMAHPHLLALRFELLPQGWSGEVEFRSRLDGDIATANVARYAGYQDRFLCDHQCRALSPDQAAMAVRMRRSAVRVGLALRTTAHPGCDRPRTLVREDGTAIEHVLRASAAMGRPIVIEKTVAICTSLDPGVTDVIEAAQAELATAGSHAQLLSSHESCWRGLWSRVAIEAGDEGLARATRFHAFHILQTVSPNSVPLDAGVPARGWHGEGYRGHVFWDELFILPFLNFRFPEVSRALLAYRWRRLDAAREMATRAGFRGAMYPWRSARGGHEVTPAHQKNMITGHWMPDHTRLERHVGSAVAFNVWQYYLATGDDDFFFGCGAEMILEIARFWASIARPDQGGERFAIRSVIGPDEYHDAYPHAATPGLDNNAYTNLMAVWTLCRGLDVLEMLPSSRREELVRQLALGPDEVESWERISRRMIVPFHAGGVISQYEGFERLLEFDPGLIPPSLADQRVDWTLRAVGRSANEYQITKQADALTLFYLLSDGVVVSMLRRLGYPFDRDRLLRTADYYLARTTHRSSLSRIVYAGALAQLDPARSWQLFQEALGTDLRALKGQSIAEGVHLGAMGGTLDTLQRRYLGISPSRAGLDVNPALPRELGRVRLGLRFRGQGIEVEADGGMLHVRSAASNVQDVLVCHCGDRVPLRPGRQLSVPGRG